MNQQLRFIIKSLASISFPNEESSVSLCIQSECGRIRTRKTPTERLLLSANFMKKFDLVFVLTQENAFS